MRNRKSRTTEQILKRYIIDPNTGCFNYTGYKNSNGYGETTGPNTLGEGAIHRISYLYFNGPIGSMHVLHKCDNPSCINPTHLFLGTHQDNMKDKAQKGRVIAHKGSNHARAKITENDVKQIRIMKENGTPRSDIATKFSISKANVDDITTRNTWKHVI